MSEAVSWLFTVNIKDGQLDAFKALVDEMSATVQANEPDTHIYEMFLSEDGKTCQVYERYANSAATLAHLGNFGEKFGEKFMATVDPAGVLVFGDSSKDVREALVPFGAVHYALIGGFAR